MFGLADEAEGRPGRPQPDAAAFEQAEGDVGGAEAFQGARVLQDLDHVGEGAGAGEGVGGGLDDAGLAAAPVDTAAAGGGVVEFLGGVADQADDAQRPALFVAADVPLGVGPARRAVAQPHPEVRAVVLHARLERLGDGLVQAAPLVVGNPDGERLGVVVVLARAHVEDGQRLAVHRHQAAVQVPVEAADAVQGQDRVRVRRPVVREGVGVRTPVSHVPTLPPLGR